VHFYEPTSTWKQCQIVNAVFKKIHNLDLDCCGPDGSKSPCNGQAGVDQSLDLTHHWNQDYYEALGFGAIVAEIGSLRPIAVGIQWSGGGAHFVAIGGFQVLFGTAGAQLVVHVEDPGYGPSNVSYTTLKDHYQGAGRWTYGAWTKR
jgi:hypothetical protein